MVVITAAASALLDNVTTVLLIAPVTFLVCERLALPVVPYLITEAMASNIGGTATLIGDPPNIIIASRGNLSFNDFLLHLAPLVVVLMAAFAGLCRGRRRQRTPARWPALRPSRDASMGSSSTRRSVNGPDGLWTSWNADGVQDVVLGDHTSEHIPPRTG